MKNSHVPIAIPRTVPSLALTLLLVGCNQSMEAADSEPSAYDQNSGTLVITSPKGVAAFGTVYRTVDKDDFTKDTPLVDVQSGAATSLPAGKYVVRFHSQYQSHVNDEPITIAKGATTNLRLGAIRVHNLPEADVAFTPLPALTRNQFSPAIMRDSAGNDSRAWVPRNDDVVPAVDGYSVTASLNPPGVQAFPRDEILLVSEGDYTFRYLVERRRANSVWIHTKDRLIARERYHVDADTIVEILDAPDPMTVITVNWDERNVPDIDLSTQVWMSCYPTGAEVGRKGEVRIASDVDDGTCEHTIRYSALTYPNGSWQPFQFESGKRVVRVAPYHREAISYRRVEVTDPKGGFYTVERASLGWNWRSFGSWKVGMGLDLGEGRYRLRRFTSDQSLVDETMFDVQ